MRFRVGAAIHEAKIDGCGESGLIESVGGPSSVVIADFDDRFRDTRPQTSIRPYVAFSPQDRPDDNPALGLKFQSALLSTHKSLTIPVPATPLEHPTENSGVLSMHAGTTMRDRS